MMDVGLGAPDYRLAVCIANRPPVMPFAAVTEVRPLGRGDIDGIVMQAGNHWRKIFSLYAKLGFALHDQGLACWQDYRDDFLLSAQSQQALLFSPPRPAAPGVKIVSGKTYAEDLGVLPPQACLRDGFFVSPEARLIVAPYFDYRQLSNARLAILVELVRDCGA
ncbi:hypothetical protein FKG94_22240 [Exilibacterium tricleocarpae]|uniref:Uncharacterized protein n=1 Tax=Exilibacterium tricleocarpae TaxID=2591008 RepID=A0A545SY31_9GAMM|nr:hypothetical protein [Exilibacterium tricleocarpae]TQV69875.1 hypothetical protein FKG94_22240 [Exilibacterium tricleocarpae]